MQMRLGKTLVAIRWLQKTNPNFRALVVAPLSVLPVWEYECSLENVPTRSLSSVKAVRQASLEPQFRGVYTVNFERLRVSPALGSLPLTHLIVDESTRIRNPQAQITKILVRYFARVPFKAILSGLPAPESMLDYYSQMQFLYGEFLGCKNYWDFRSEHFLQSGFDWYPKPSSYTLIKTSIAEKAFTLSRKDAGLGNYKVYETRYVEMNPEQKKLTKSIEKDFSYNDDFATINTKWMPVKFTWLARVAGGFTPDSKLISDGKINELYYLLTGELKNESVLVWFRFNSEIKAVHQYLTSKDIRSDSITGEDFPIQRRNKVQAFKEKKLDVLLLQIKCGKFGLDLSEADTSIYFSNSYDCEDRAQSEDRIINPLKKRPLLYLDLVTRNSVDEDVLFALKGKQYSTSLFLKALSDHWKERHKPKCQTKHT
jgi:SNF2 family DNA or RNA helicase